MVSPIRERYREELRKSILDAARDAFARGGYESVSMRSIAETLGVSHASLYAYFEDKEAIFDALVAESFDQLAAALRGLPGRNGDPVRFLKRAARKYIEFGLKNPGAYEFAFILRRPPAAQKPHLAYDYLRGAVQRCIDANRLRTRNVDAASQTLWAAMHGLTSLLILRPSFPWAKQKTLIGLMIESAVDGLVLRS